MPMNPSIHRPIETKNSIHLIEHFVIISLLAYFSDNKLFPADHKIIFHAYSYLEPNQCVWLNVELR